MNPMFRLNKIGKNPHLVSDRDNLDSDCKTVNAFVNALSAPDGSMESLARPSTPRMHRQALICIWISLYGNHLHG